MTSYIKNPGSVAQEAEFVLAIPDSAFISNLSMIIKGQEYVSEVKETKEAEEIYENALTYGDGAGSWVLRISLKNILTKIRF